MRKIKFILFLALFLVASRPSHAATKPNFPSCVAPSGTVIASYDQGTHGIVGSQATYTGRDVVYRLTEDTVLQCFCSTSGEGIQTNWWRASSLSPTEVEQLQAEGWYYVPAGNLWGLDASAFVARNYPYRCSSTTTTTTSSNTSSSGGVGGAVLGEATTAGDVLGLAATGQNTILYILYGLGLVLVALGYRGIKKSRYGTTSL